MEKKLIFLGPPGSGKGTQAKEIACELGLAHISMGDILRQAIKDRTPSGIKAEEHLKAGTLVPDDLVNEIARDVLRKASGGFILDGYPRTVYQAQFLAGITEITKAVYIDVPKKITARQRELLEEFAAISDERSDDSSKFKSKLKDLFSM